MWSDGTGNQRIRATILGNSGANVKADFQVNTSMAGAQNEASVVALADGGFVITWEDHNADLVRGKRFDAAGDPVGAEFTVKSGVAPDSPDSALLTDGRFAYAIGDISSGDADVFTGIFDPRTSPIIAAGNVTSRVEGATLQGTAGAEHFFGLAGNDVFVVNNSGDFVDESVGGGIDTIQSLFDFSLADAAHILGAVENLTLLGAAINGTGNALANTIIGNSSANVLDGLDGNDLLFGGLGRDTIIGSGADDIVRGGKALDTVFGGDGNDRLFGNGGRDMILGEGGSDLIVGGKAKDVLIGGLGKDIFDFNASVESRVGANRDIINQFSRAEHDKIDLKTIDADTTTGGNQAFDLIGAAAFSGTAGELRFAAGLLQGDINGDGIADLEVKVAGLGAAANSDFVL